MRRALPLLAAALAGAALLALAGLLLGPAGDEGAEPVATWRAPDGTFSIALPDGWKAAAYGPAATVLTRGDGRGTVVVRRTGRLAEAPERLGRSLTRQLRKSFGGDVKLLQASAVPVGRTTGALVSFEDPSRGRVQSLVFTSDGDRGYSLDLVAPAGAADVAREQGAMVRSFTSPA